MKTQLRLIEDDDVTYTVLMFVCPGCALDGSSGLHLLPVNTTAKMPSWDWDGNYERPTISPSILTRGANDKVCNSFLKDGWFDFLSDCSHKLAGMKIPIPDLPTFVAPKPPNLAAILASKGRSHGLAPG